jgi:polyferredoxin
MSIENLKWKFLDRPLLPIMASHVDALPFLVLFALFFLSGYALQSKKARCLRPFIQAFSLAFFVFIIHRCFGALRGWIFALKDIGRDDVSVFYNLFIFVPLVAFTIMFGRVFCGWICPLGTVQEFSFRHPVLRKFVIGESLIIKYCKSFILIALLGVSIFFLVKLKPQTFFFLENIASIWGLALIIIVALVIWRPDFEILLKRIRYLSLVLWLLLIIFGIFTIEPWCVLLGNEIDYSSILSLFIVLTLTFLISLPWCRYLCPLGSFLSLLVKFSQLKIKLNPAADLTPKLAKRICPTEALKKDSLDNSSCVYCSRCVQAGISKIEGN